MYIVVSVGCVYEFVCISDLGEIMSTFLGHVKHGGEDGNVCRIREETCEISSTRKNDAFVMVLSGEP